MVCIEVQQDEEAAWHNTGCTSGEVDSSWSCSSVPECLLPVQYEAKCESLNGRAKYGKKHGANYMYCEIPPVLGKSPSTIGESQFFVVSSAVAYFSIQLAHDVLWC